MIADLTDVEVGERELSNCWIVLFRRDFCRSDADLDFCVGGANRLSIPLKQPIEEENPAFILSEVTFALCSFGPE